MLDGFRTRTATASRWGSGLWLGRSTFEVDPLYVCFALVLMNDPIALELQITNWWLDVFLQDFLVGPEFRVLSIMGSWCGPEAEKHPNIITLPPPSFTLGVTFLLSCLSFMADVTGRVPSKKFHFPLNSPQNVIPKGMWVFMVVLANMRRAFMFLLAVVFALKLSHGYYFCPVSI